MENLNISVMIQSTLAALKATGMAEATVGNYRSVGFGELCRRFAARGVAEYSVELADVVVREVRMEFDHGALSAWTFRTVRRAASLLELFHRTGAVNLSKLAPWDELRLPPKPEERADGRDLHTLILTCHELLRQQGIGPATLDRSYWYAFRSIFRAHEERGLTQYSGRVADELLVRSRSRVVDGDLHASVWRALRRCVVALEDVAATGVLRPRGPYHPRWGLRQPCPELHDALVRFCDAAVAELGWSRGSIKTARTSIRQFLFAAEDAGITTVRGFTLRTVSDAVTDAAKRREGGVDTLLRMVRAFLRHLHAVGATTSDLSWAVPRLSAPRRVVREGFTAEEVRTLIAACDGDSTIARRDRAIMTLAAQHGLRACDLVRLLRTDIDWRAGQIRIVQKKTHRALCLPLAVETGNAIAGYLLGCRVVGDSPYLFVSCDPGPIRPMNAGSIGSLMSRRMRQCGIDGRAPRRGAHSFRRGLGTGMLNAEVPVDTVMEVLGHRHINSARPYLSVSENGLRACAISLAAAVGAGA